MPIEKSRRDRIIAPGEGIWRNGKTEFAYAYEGVEICRVYPSGRVEMKSLEKCLLWIEDQDTLPDPDQARQLSVLRQIVEDQFRGSENQIH